MPKAAQARLMLADLCWTAHWECEDEEDKIKRACKPEKERSDTHNEVKGKSKIGSLLKMKRKGKKDKGRRDKDGWHWTDDHCDGLEVPLGSAKEAQEYAKQMEDVFKQLPNELNVLGALEAELKDMAVNAGMKAGAKWGAKAGIKQLAGSSLPVVGNILMGIWSVADAAVAIGDVNEIRKVATESLEQLDVLKNKLNNLQNVSKEFENFSNLSADEQAEKARELGAQGQDLLATVDECTRARKCNLVPYKADGVGNPLGKRDSKNPSKVESAHNGGCCNGQTGHHLIPGGSVKESCKNYDHDAAPTVCVEGTSWDVGSHKRVHEAYAVANKDLADRGRIDANGTMSMDDAVDAGAKSHKEAFPLSRCSEKCIKAQLASYYKACGNARPKMVNPQAKAIVPGQGKSK